MLTNDIVFKSKILIDGNEIPGLVSAGEIKDIEGTIDVPSQNRTHVVGNGIFRFEPFPLVYKVQTNAHNETIFENWHFKHELHDVTKIYTDAVGNEYKRIVAKDCECAEYTWPETNAASPNFGQFTVLITCSSDPKY